MPVISRLCLNGHGACNDAAQFQMTGRFITARLPTDEVRWNSLPPSLQQLSDSACYGTLKHNRFVERSITNLFFFLNQRIILGSSVGFIVWSTVSGLLVHRWRWILVC